MYRLSDYRVLRTVSTPPDEIPYGVRMLGAPLEWSETKGQGIKVAVLDTGRPQHPDLRVTASFASSNLRNSHDELDHNGHSTHVCGTICANGKIKGVAPEAELFTAKVLDDTGMGNDDTITEGVYWAIDKGVDVINMSLGGRNPQPKLKKAIDKAVEQGICVVCAAGNAGEDYLAYPAKFPNTIAVGGVDRNKDWVDFSSVGEEVDICALGTTVLSTYLDNRYAILQGTSMATPHITGAIILLQARVFKRKGKKFSPEQVKEYLQIEAEDVGEPGKDTRYGYGVFSFGRFEQNDYVRPKLQLQIGSKEYYKDGIKKVMDTVPVLDSNNRTLVPVRFIAEEYGATVHYIAETRTIVIT